MPQGKPAKRLPKLRRRTVEDITFDGVIFPAVTDANTNFEIDMYRAGYDLVRIDAEATEKNNKVKYDYDGALVCLRWHF